VSLLHAATTVALALAAGAAVVAFLTSRRARLAETRDAEPEALMAGGAVVALLMVLDHRRVLRWDYGIDAGGVGRVPLPGAGLLLGLTLLAALGATLLLGAARWAGGASRLVDPRVLARRLLILAVGLGALAAAVIVSGAARLGPASMKAAAGDVAAIVLAAAWVAWSIALWLRPVPDGDARELSERSGRQTALAAALAAIALAVGGLESWVRVGSYASAPVAAAASAALVGLAAIQPTRFACARRGLLAAVLLLLLLRPPS
jgi:hypothetical protein